MCIGHKVFYSSVPVLLEIFFGEIILSFSRDGRRNVRASSREATDENGPTEIKTEMDKQNRQIQTILPNNEFVEVLQLLHPHIRMVGEVREISPGVPQGCRTGWEGHTQLIPLMHFVIRQLGSNSHADHKMVTVGPNNCNCQQAVGEISIVPTLNNRMAVVCTVTVHFNLEFKNGRDLIFLCVEPESFCTTS